MNITEYEQKLNNLNKLIAEIRPRELQVDVMRRTCNLLARMRVIIDKYKANDPSLPKDDIALLQSSILSPAYVVITYVEKTHVETSHGASLVTDFDVNSVVPADNAPQAVVAVEDFICRDPEAHAKRGCLVFHLRTGTNLPWKEERRIRLTLPNAIDAG